MKKDGGAAFPMFNNQEGNCDRYDFIREDGMTLRDYFAGQALAGILSHSDFTDGSGTTMNSFVVYARSAYDFADAMLAEREKE